MLLRPKKKSVKIKLDKNTTYSLQLTDMIDISGRNVSIRSSFTGATFIIGSKKKFVLKPDDLSKIKKEIGKNLEELKNWRQSIKV